MAWLSLLVLVVLPQGPEMFLNYILCFLVCCVQYVHVYCA